MRLLLDACIWGGAVAYLEESGHDVVWVGDWSEDPGDDEILATASRDRRILITLDKDFGELAVVYRKPHAGILRIVGCSAREQGPVCRRILAEYGDVLAGGALVTVESLRVRIRPPDA